METSRMNESPAQLTQVLVFRREGVPGLEPQEVNGLGGKTAFFCPFLSL